MPYNVVQIRILRAILTGWSKIKEKKGIVFFRCDIFKKTFFLKKKVFPSSVFGLPGPDP